ncbi:MAG: DNA primase [Mycoplasma sp.]
MSTKFDYKIINQIRDNISIKDIIGNYLSLSKKGNNYWAICPFHDDKNASLSVNEQKKVYKCFSCNNGGDVFTFVKNYEKISYYKAILKVSELSNLDKNLLQQITSISNEISINSELIEINEMANKYFKLFLKKEENNFAMEYLNKRGLNSEIIEKFDIGYAPDDSKIIIDLVANQDDIVAGAKKFKYSKIKEAGLSNLINSGEYLSFFRNRIIFSIKNENNEIVGFSGRAINDEQPKYLNTATTEIFNKNEILYNLNNLENELDVETLFLVEGFMDVIALYKIGVKNVVATMGVAFSKNHMNTLSKLFNLKNIILCFDNDEAGQKSIAKTADIIKTKYTPFVIEYTTKSKDIDEIISSNPEQAKQTINNIISYNTFQIRDLISKTIVNNEAEKITLMKKLSTILNSYTEEYLLQQDIKYVIEKLSLDEVIFKEMILKKTLRPKKINSKKELQKNQIEFKNSVSKQIKPLKFITDNTEKRIIDFCIASKDSFNLFGNDFGKFLNPENEKILIILEDFYLKNKSSESFKPSDIERINTTEEIKIKLLSMAIKVDKMKLIFAQEKLREIIIQHNSKLRTYEFDKLNKKIVEAEKRGDIEEKNRLTKLGFSILNNKN